MKGIGYWHHIGGKFEAYVSEALAIDGYTAGQGRTARQAYIDLMGKLGAV